VEVMCRFTSMRLKICDSPGSKRSRCGRMESAEDYFLGYNPRNSRWTGDFDRFKAGSPTA